MECVIKRIQIMICFWGKFFSSLHKFCFNGLVPRVNGLREAPEAQWALNSRVKIGKRNSAVTLKPLNGFPNDSRLGDLNIWKPKETPSLPKRNQQVGRLAASVLLTLNVGGNVMRTTVAIVGFVGFRLALQGTEEPLAFLCTAATQKPDEQRHGTCWDSSGFTHIKNLDINPYLQHLFTAYGREPF